MKIILSAVLAAAATACMNTPMTETAATPSPNLSEQQALVGARAGDKLPDGAETYVDGERVGGGGEELQQVQEQPAPQPQR